MAIKKIVPRAPAQNFPRVEMELALIAMIIAGVVIFLLFVAAVVILIYEERNLRRTLHPYGGNAPPIGPLRLSQDV
jgi:hypothetical protein